MDEVTFDFEHPRPLGWLVWAARALFLPVLAIVGILIWQSLPYVQEAPLVLDCTADVAACEARLPDWFEDLPTEEAFLRRVFARRVEILESIQAPTPRDLRVLFDMGNTGEDPDWWLENLEMVAGYPLGTGERVVEADRRAWKTETEAYLAAKRAFRRQRLLEIQIESVQARQDWDAHHGEGGWILVGSGLAGLGLLGGVVFLIRLAQRKHENTKPFRAVLGRHRYAIRERSGLYEDLPTAQVRFLVFGAASDGHVGDLQGLEAALRERVQAASNGKTLDPTQRARLENLTGQRDS